MAGRLRNAAGGTVTFIQLPISERVGDFGRCFSYPLGIAAGGLPVRGGEAGEWGVEADLGRIGKGGRREHDGKERRTGNAS